MELTARSWNLFSMQATRLVFTIKTARGKKSNMFSDIPAVKLIQKIIPGKREHFVALNCTLQMYFVLVKTYF